MKKLQKLMYINTFLTSVIVVIIIFLTAFFIGKSEMLKPENLILLATFGAIVFYSLETKLLTNATKIANALQAEPLLVLQSRMEKPQENIYIVNYGKGPAFNIEMEIENIQGFFNFFISNPNPLAYMQERILLLLTNQNTDQNIEARVTLSFDKIEGDEKVERKRVFNVSNTRNGWRIKFIG